MRTTQSSTHQILAFDVGQKRLGIARAHSQARIAEPLQILFLDGQNEFRVLKELFEQFSPELLVVGVPLNSHGQPGSQAKIIKRWVKKMVAVTQFKGRIIYWDETLTTQASQSLQPQTKFVDDIAASLILDDYLNGTAN